METQRKVKSRAAVMRSGKRRVKVDWAFRRLRNQVAKQLAAGDSGLRHDLKVALEAPTTFSEMERTVVKMVGPRIWHRVMDRFFGHEINRSVNA